MSITTLSLCIASVQLAYSTVTIKPDTVNPDISVNLAPDTRISSLPEFQNNGVYNNEWRINFKYDGQSMTDWYAINYITTLNYMSVRDNLL